MKRKNKDKYKKLIAQLWRFFPIGKANIKIPILCYHSINNKYCEEADPVSVAQFDEQLKYLKKNHQVISLKLFVDYLTNNIDIDIPNNAVVITFDDGYIDNYLHAFPLLKKYNIPATFFIVTNFIAQNIKLIPTKGWEAFTWQQAREMISSGLIDFCPHTHSHPILSKLKVSDIEYEIKQSRKLIIQELGTEPDIFAYPNGQENDIPNNSSSLLRKNGFSAACSTLWSTSHNLNQLMKLNRVMINGNDDLSVFHLKVTGAYDYIYYLHKLKTIISFFSK